MLCRKPRGRWSVVMFSRETDNKKGNRTQDSPIYKQVATKVCMANAFTVSNARGAQLDTVNAQDMSHRLTGPILL